jgi:vanillate O-demethylase monooxygenase subunit
MVEAQQKRLDEFGDQGLVDIASDANRMHMRRIVERLIVAEQSAIAAE